MINNNRKWVILSVSNVTDEMIDNSIQTSLDTLRKNADNSKCILKWSGDTPSCFNGIKTYTHLEILEELKKLDWEQDNG